MIKYLFNFFAAANAKCYIKGIARQQVYLVITFGFS